MIKLGHGESHLSRQRVSESKVPICSASGHTSAHFGRCSKTSSFERVGTQSFCYLRLILHKQPPQDLKGFQLEAVLPKELVL